jgi:23S rRNA pseudouridine1911/1915/1917 synthase
VDEFADHDDDACDVADSALNQVADAPVVTQCVVTREQAGERLDAVVAVIGGVTRAQAQRFLADGMVTVDARPPGKAAYRVRYGDVIVLTVMAAQPLHLVAEDIPIDVLFEDEHLIVINKAAGMVVHPAPGHSTGTLVHALMFHCKDLSGIGGVLRPGIVHRLDKDTSGVMVVSKHDAAHQGLAAAFAAKSQGVKTNAVGIIERRYIAICTPGPRPNLGQNGTIRTMYGRHPVNRKEFSSKVFRGKSAVTHWRVEERFIASALMSFELETGRTHQIRVHAADHGFPVLGDAIYGHRQRDDFLLALHRALNRQALHAASLQFVHPITGAPMDFRSPIPLDMRTAVESLRSRV